MGKFPGIKCDQCKRVEELQEDLQPPPNWITLRVSKSRDIETEIYLCGGTCGMRWCKARAKVEKTLTDKITGTEFCNVHCDTSDEHQHAHDSACPLGKLQPSRQAR